MALQIAKETGFGVQANYWKVGDYIMNHNKKTARFSLEGYFDESSRRLGKAPMATTVITFSLSAPTSDKSQVNSFPFTIDGNITQQAYNAIKQLPDWQDATDVLED